MTAFLALISNGALQWLIGIIGGAAGIFAAWQAAKTSGKNEVKLNQASQSIADIGVRNEVDRKVGGLSDADVAQQLRDHYTHK